MSVGKVGKIREFDVKSGNWTLYEERLQMFFKVNKVEKDMWLPMLITGAGAGGCTACGWRGHSKDECRYKHFVCSKCKQSGHLRRVCPRMEANRGRGKRRGVNHVDANTSDHPRAGAGDSSSDELEEELHQLCLSGYNPVNHSVYKMSDTVDRLLNRYKELFSEGLGRFTGGKATLRLREGATPVFCQHYSN
uniref:CCHC-type domain-containing protein n=1 Tax=Heliothis virescens TaxID=7102 RepID=A0A2A4IZJ4_HELVI